MHIAFGRRARLITLGAGLITSAAVAIATATPAFADTTDTGGTATIAIPRANLVLLAKAGIIVLPGSPATSSYTAGTSKLNSLDAFTFTVTGGNGEVSNFFGIVNLGGSLVLINSAHSHTATVSNLELNFFNGSLTGTINGGTAQIPVAFIGGDMSAVPDTGSGTESFSATALLSAAKGAQALNKALGTTVFVKGVPLGGITTTFTVTHS